MARHAHEFQCDHNCGFFNYPMLDEKMNGNYTIICGNCGHEHYRHIKDGVVTADRHFDGADDKDTIHVMQSATSKERRKMGSVTQFRNMVAAGLAS